MPLPEVQLGAPGEDCHASYSLQSSRNKYVTVSADGVIRGVRAGSATITLTTHNGLTASLKVTVRRAPSKIALSVGTLTLGVGEETRIAADLPKKTAGGVRFESSAPDQVCVSPDGRVRALAEGSATITATSYNGKRAQCAVTVRRAPESVFLDRSELILGVGEAYPLEVTLPEGSAGRCLFSVEGGAAGIDASTGVVRAVAAGSAVVCVRSYNGREATCAVTVKEAPAGIQFREKSVTLYVGDKYALLPPLLSGADAACGKPSYKSSSTKYVKVSAGGVVTGVKAGKAKLTVCTYNGKKAAIWVYVKAAPKAIAFSEGALRLLVDQTCTPELELSGGVPFSYTLSSSDERVARILDGRTVQAVGGGSATITATAFNGGRASIPLTVPALPDRVALKASASLLGAGDCMQLEAVMPSGQDSALRFESSDPTLAEVDASGVVRALRQGSVTISVHTQNGLRGECGVRVAEAPTRIMLSPRQAVRALDEGSLQLHTQFASDAEGGRIAFASSDPGVASVSPDGLVRFLAAGTVRITAQTYNGCVCSCVIAIGEAPGAMYFERESCAVALGDSVGLSVGFDRGCESYTLTSDNPAVAAIADGEVRGLALGRATIVATSRSGYRASCAVEVVSPPSGIALEPHAASSS